MYTIISMLFSPSKILIAGTSVLLAFAICCGYKVHTLSEQQKEIKQDYSAINNISFGILSVNKWRDLVVTAVSHRIEHFDLSHSERDSLKKEITNILNGLIDKADSLIDAPQKSIGGKLRKLAFHAFVKEDKLRQLVPSFSRKIMEELTKPQSKRKLKYLAEAKLEDLGSDTFDSSRIAEKAKLDSIFKRYHVTDDASFNPTISAELDRIHSATYSWSYALLSCVAVILALWYLLRKKRPLYVPLYIMSILLALVLLLVGLTTTMIDIDARIKSLSFNLIGETIAFKDQVIFFQSKSIMDVVSILIGNHTYDSILVGILILCFSILFPIAKLVSTGIYLLSREGLGKGKIVSYFAFHSGKWSMADVTVVAIFMAYIGFNGILDSQMRSLDQQSDTFSSIATNDTSLQPGYLIFVVFVIYGLVLSQILKNIMQPPQRNIF